MSQPTPKTNDVAVCIITNNSVFETIYCLERLMSTTNVNFRFHILDNASSDKRIIDYCKALCEETKGYFKPVSRRISTAEASNLLLNTVYQQFCVTMPVNILVSNNWLEDLLTAHNSCSKSGCVSIRNGNEKLHFMPIIHEQLLSPEDILKNVHITENNIVNGLMMFDMDRLKEVGEFDERLKAPGFEFMEFCFRFSANGYKNYYIMRNSCVRTKLENEVLFPKRTEESKFQYKTQIEIMVKSKQFIK